MKKYLRSVSVFVLTLFVLFLGSDPVIAQNVTVGKGSYTTTYPEGRSLPKGADEQLITPRISSEFNQLIQTNDYWSNLIYPYSGSDFLNLVTAHPIAIESDENGFKVGYSVLVNTTDVDYQFAPLNTIQIGIAGLTATNVSAHSYGDWTFSAKKEFGNASLIATTGHGLPYTFFEVSGGDIQISSASDFTVWHNVDEVIGLSINGMHYALFAPSGSVWSGSEVLTSSLNGKGFVSVAVLPDSTSETLEFYRKHAYAQVINSTVEWQYDESSAQLTSTFSYQTLLRDSAAGNVDYTLTALYRHQWLNTDAVLTGYSYASPRGEMKVFSGNTFSTVSIFSGILPALPDLGDYDRLQLLDFVKQVATERLPVDDTYNNGKQMGRFAEVIHIADQLGAISERDYLLDELKLRLESWFTVGGDQQYYYNDTWNVLHGYPGSFGSNSEINDHHFHSAYAIKAAATIAQYDSVWASKDNWGGMVNLLIRDANNWEREDEMFPFLRNFDAYAGHAWASGHGDFNFDGIRPGNNQESSSESMNFATASILWGELTNQKEIRDLGIFLYTNENEAIDQYWFDVDNAVFPESFPKKAVGRVWSATADHNTWFGSDPEFIHGINLLPINAGSFYLGKHPNYIMENYNEVVAERGGQPIHWKDVFWQYLSMSDADLALSYYNADINYNPFDGESRAHTLHWLYNMKKMGHYNTEITSNVPLYAVFVNSNNDTTYTAYNANLVEKLVTFSDGFTMLIPGQEMKTYHAAEIGSIIPPAPIPLFDAEKVMSVFSDSYPNFVGVELDPEIGQSTEASIVVFEGNNTLKLDNFDFQRLDLQAPINIISRDSLHFDVYTEESVEIQIRLVSSDESDARFTFNFPANEWISTSLALHALSDSIDLGNLSQIYFSGSGTVYLDNIFFSGDNPVVFSPTSSAPDPIIDPIDVISIFSDSYNNIEIADFNPDWQQQTEVSIIEIEGNQTLKYSNLNYQGTAFENPTDVSNMEWFHLDYWTNNSSELKIYLISPGPNEIAFEITVNQNSWQSVDIPLTEFSSVVDLTQVFQLKIEGNGTIYLDNLYFAKAPDLSVAPTPVHDSTKVVSLFSDHYQNIVVDTWSAPWDQANVEDVVVCGDNMKLFTNVNFAGIEFFRTDQIDGTNLTHLHFDMWTADAIDSTTNFKVKLVDFGANGSFGGGDDVEHELTFDKSNTNGFESKSWISFDIPLTDFENMTTRANLSQLLFVSRSGIDDFYMDNLYFYQGDATNAFESTPLTIPNTIHLQQNYPNPFNPTTTIGFSIPKTQYIELSIYNSIGQQVATLVNGELSAGLYNLNWEAGSYSSGIYFYQLRTNVGIFTKQMLLIK
ncbi:MAG: glycosyl hydrolase [bacterium]|nr:glycosyl hydrolase [bacterium]